MARPVKVTMPVFVFTVEAEEGKTLRSPVTSAVVRHDWCEVGSVNVFCRPVQYVRQNVRAV